MLHLSIDRPLTPPPPPDVLEKKEAQFCSTFYKVQVVYEHVQNTLQREIDNRLEIG